LNDKKLPNNILPIALVLFVGMVTVTITFLPIAFGAQEWVTMATDKEAYLDGDTIIVRGTVFQLYSSYPMSLMVIAPNNNIVYLDQITVNSDKKFSTEFRAGGSQMKFFGDYKIIAQYGSPTRTVEIMFQYGVPPVVEPEPIVIPPPRQITVDGYVMANSMTSGKVTNMSPNQNAKLLTVSVNETVEAGVLTIAIPRAVLDSVVDRVDVEFFAFAGSVNIDVEEVDTNEFERTLMIKYPVGTRTIEIMGTYAIPEFDIGDGMVVIILAIIIITAIVMTKRIPFAPIE